jgi:predicted thioesterase
MLDASFGRTASLQFHVSQEDTAIALGSGELAVLATPRVIAWLEAACVHCLRLDERQASVGTRVDIEHVKASGIGARIDVTATVAYVDGRLIRFDVVAEQSAPPEVDETSPDEQARADQVDGVVTRIAHGTMTRVVVDRERFLARLNPGG